MLEKLQGGVACAHCRSVSDAAQRCPICGQSVCEACLAADNCAAPRLRTLDLGNNVSVEAVDAQGRLALISQVSGRGRACWLHDLADDRQVARLQPPQGVQDWVVSGCVGFVPGRLIWQGHDSPRATPEHWNHWFMVADVSEGLLRVVKAVETGCEGFPHYSFSADGRWMLGSYFNVRAYLLELEGMQITTRFDLHDQVIHSLAISSELDLIAVGLFGAVHLWTLSDQRDLGRLTIEDGELTCLCLGAGRLIAISEDEVPHVVQIDNKRPPARWEQRTLDRFKAKGKPTPDEAHLSPDGRLLAVRLRKKEAAVIDLETGAAQRLKGHRGRVNMVRFVAGGSVLLTGDDEGGVRFWPRDGQRVVERG